MYNKLFTKILDSSIWLAPDPHRLVWITLIAAMDEDGNAMFACADNLAARARVTVAEAEAAIASFEAPDPKSGDPENEGRRIERIPGGWAVLNAHKYRAIVTRQIARDQTRARTARWRQRKAGDASVTPRDESVTPSEAVSVSEARADKNQSARAPQVGRAEIREDPRTGEHVPRGTSRPIFDGVQFYRTMLEAIYPRHDLTETDVMQAGRALEVLVSEDFATEAVLVDRAVAFRSQQDAAGNTDTKYVMKPAKFYGSEGHWRGPFPIVAAKAKSASADRTTWRPDPEEDRKALGGT